MCLLGLFLFSSSTLILVVFVVHVFILFNINAQKSEAFSADKAQRFAEVSVAKEFILDVDYIYCQIWATVVWRLFIGNHRKQNGKIFYNLLCSQPANEPQHLFKIYSLFPYEVNHSVDLH